MSQSFAGVLPLLSALAVLVGCEANPRVETDPPPAPPLEQQEREFMVHSQIEARGIRDPRVLQAMREIPRADFVPAEVRDRAHRDSPLPIGYGQTISQPYIVAFMTEQLELDGSEKVLEIGTGSGYQAAILGRLAARVYSIEIVEALAQRSRALLEAKGIANVEVRSGDGYGGWPEHAPFDAILLTAAPDDIPEPLLEQLAVGGRLVAPVGVGLQELVLVTRDEEGLHFESLLPVRFVPMVGEAERD
ncbi:MAG: protein-L-isoaspartate(D-aspartate) O-methyltransferase [Myxococcota bacterium]